LVVDASREDGAGPPLSLPGELQRFMESRRRAAKLEFRIRNLDENVRVLYSVGQQLYVVGCWAPCPLCSRSFFDGRGQHQREVVAEIATGLFVTYLCFFFAGSAPGEAQLGEAQLGAYPTLACGLSRPCGRSGSRGTPSRARRGCS